MPDAIVAGVALPRWHFMGEMNMNGNEDGAGRQ